MSGYRSWLKNDIGPQVAMNDMRAMRGRVPPGPRNGPSGATGARPLPLCRRPVAEGASGSRYVVVAAP